MAFGLRRVNRLGKLSVKLVSKISNVVLSHQRHRRTTCDLNTALCKVHRAHRAVKMSLATPKRDWTFNNYIVTGHALFKYYGMSDFKVIMHQIRFLLKLCHRPAGWGAYRPLNCISGESGRRGEGKGWEREVPRNIKNLAQPPSLTDAAH